MLEAGPYLVLVFLLGMECSPVTFAVSLVLILVPTGVGGQQSPQQAQTKERLRGGNWLGGGESVHQETQAACQHHDLQQHHGSHSDSDSDYVSTSFYKFDQLKRRFRTLYSV